MSISGKFQAEFRAFHLQIGRASLIITVLLRDAGRFCCREFITTSFLPPSCTRIDNSKEWHGKTF
jgi:hypothetical protein